MKGSELWRGNGRATILEVAFLCCLGLIVLLWLIPRATSGTGIGLNPSTMPTASIIATMVFVVADGLLRLMRKSARAESDSIAPSPILVVGGLSVLAVVLLTFLGPVVSVLVTLPLLMLSLNERRWSWIACTTFGGTLITYWALG